MKNWFWKGCKPNFVFAACAAERIICLSNLYPKPVSLSRNAERAAPRFPIWPCTRWGFPCRVACASRGALLPHLFTITAGFHRRLFIFCGTVRQKVFQPSARVYLNRTDLSYAASRPLVFGLSSPGSRRKRFSALPKPV